MWVLIVMSCVIFQTAVTIYLFNINKTGDSFEKNLTRILIVLLGHLCTKFLLLVILKNEALYGQVASGFGLAYGPLLYIITRAFVKEPLQRSLSLMHLVPFFTSSLIYLTLLTGSISKNISNSFVINYTSYFQWFVVVSLLGYAFTVKSILYSYRKDDAFNDTAIKVKWKLINNIATILAAGILTGIFFELTQFVKAPIRDFHLRVLPYALFAFIPVIILRYKLEQKSNRTVLGVTEESEVVAETISTPQALPVVLGTAEADKPIVAIAPPVADATAAPKRYEKSSLDEASMNAYEVMLNKYVEKSKVYLNAELSLEELAHQVKIPKHHLTQLLNDRLNKNFYSYINEYRIEEAIKRLKNVKNEANILSLAYDCGFNSKSSFNNYFKRVTGYTPSAYRKAAESSTPAKRPANGITFP